MTESWFNDAVRGLCAAIDRTVFSLISTVYEILQQISRVSVFSTDSIREFSSKIYTLLGLIMLFKVAFSFITYIVNPDQINDKAKGAHKIVLNVLLVLVMIIITPTAFDKLYKAQSAILREQLIPKFILGTEGNIGVEKNYLISDKCPANMAMAASDGDFISILIFRPFFQPENDRTGDLDKYCSIGTDIGNLGTVSKYLVGNIYNSAPGGVKELYVIDYKFFLSTLVGIVVLLVLVSFCFDVAVRALKLAFLQIIAPIPIISYVDPNSGKNGIFSKWLKEVGKTWADLFVRLLALFFAVYVIGVLVSQESLATIDGEPIKYKFWVDLLLIIGALIFAKQLPKLIENILGIKMSGNLTLNPMKKIREQALGGKAVTGAMKGSAALVAGAGMGVAANTAALLSNAKKDGWKKALMGESTGKRGTVRAVGTVLGVGAGGISAAFHGAQGAYKNDSLKKGVMPGLKKSVDNRDTRDKRQDAGYNLGTRIEDTLKGYAGIKTEAKNRDISISNTISGLQTALSNLAYELREHTSKLNATNLSKFASVSVDESGNYIFKDENNNKISWTDSSTNVTKTAFTEDDLKKMFADTNTKPFGDIDPTAHDDALQYIRLQAESNKISKSISDYQKRQALYKKEDSQKSNNQ